MSPLAPRVSKFGFFRKYCNSSGASWCHVKSPLMNGIRSFPNSDSINGFIYPVCAPYAHMWTYSACLSAKRLRYTVFGGSVPSSDAVFPRRSEATFQGRPLATWGPRQGQRGSNAGIVLSAQHAFSPRHGTSKQPLISERSSR